MSSAKTGGEVQLATYKRTWVPLAKAAAWAAGIAGAFLTAPAQYTFGQSTTPAVVFLQFANRGRIRIGLLSESQQPKQSVPKASPRISWTIRHRLSNPLLFLLLSPTAVVLPSRATRLHRYWLQPDTRRGPIPR